MTADATAASQRPPKRRRRVPAVFRVGLWVLMATGVLWAFSLWRMRQIDELVHGSRGGVDVQRAPSWTTRFLGLELLPLHREPAALSFRGMPHDEEWYSRLRRVNDLIDLDLSNTQIGDAGLQYLQHLRGLTVLDLSGTRVTDRGMKT